MTKEAPLQYTFDGQLVDTRSRKQKQAAKKQKGWQQAEMFRQRDLAQPGVTARPQLPGVARNGQPLKMALQIQDPRSEEEKAQAQDEAAKKNMASLLPLPEGEPTQASHFYRLWQDLTEQHQGALVMIKMGDFFETFDDMAETVAQELDLVLTSRHIAKDTRVPMAGVPAHSAENYAARLVNKGYQVALCELTDATTQDPTGQTPVESQYPPQPGPESDDS